MTAPSVCPQCNKPLPSDGPAGLCPQCLLKAAWTADSAATGLHDTTSETDVALDPGTRLKYFGDYELLSEIARGGMGVVWKARQTRLNRDVAIKMIRAGALASPAEVGRFLREAEAAANLQHPNIVAIHEVGEHEGQHYFSMDLVAGRDLGALVKEGPLLPQVAARYVKQIADAIHFAHQRGTLHRDLKPQNVLIDSADQPRITDFGLAKIAKDDSQLTQSGVVMGSPSYMPPEQAAGRQGDIGPASDVYSLGAMLYELLTGQPPFRGATIMATLREVMEQEPVAPRRRKADIPPDLETICLKCLEKSPSARYPTARALAEELNRFLTGEPILAQPASPVRKAVSWMRRHPGLLAALAAAVMVALAIGVFYFIEENAFLRARQANPELTQVPGPYHENLETFNSINVLAGMAGIFLMLILVSRSRGKAIKDTFDPAIENGPTQPFSPRTRTLAIIAGLLLVASGIILILLLIQAHVWEGKSLRSVSQFVQIYPSIYFGMAAIMMVIRDYLQLHYGTLGAASPPAQPLTEDQKETLRRALVDYDLPTALQSYREFVPEASKKDAELFVYWHYFELKNKHPEQFTMPPLSIAALNGRAMLKCAVIEIIILGVLWLALPQPSPVTVLSRFAYSFLLGLGVIAGIRVKGFWKRMLLLIPAFAAMILSDAFVPPQVEPSSRFGVYLCGIVAGAFLMLTGFNHKPKRESERIVK